jgi:hypothetical protein
MLYPTVLQCSTVFQPIITVYAYIVKVSHDHVLLVRICNNLMHMWHHVTNHLIISNDKDSNSENRIKLRVRDNLIMVDIIEESSYIKQEDPRLQASSMCALDIVQEG